MARQRKAPAQAGKKGGGWFAFLKDFGQSDLAQRVNAPDLSEGTILAWADACFERTGRWPTKWSGAIPESPGETWMAVEAALCFGLRGLAPGSTLARLLSEARGRYHPLFPPSITLRQILSWADAYHVRAGHWPNPNSGQIPGQGGMTWCVVNHALREGRGGLPPGSSLAALLEERRGYRNRAHLPRYSEKRILKWADSHRARTGRWPSLDSGPVGDAPGETWSAIDAALRAGTRGLPGDSTLADLLARRRGKPNRSEFGRLTEKQILAWADAWRARTGKWPRYDDPGLIPDAGRTWVAVDASLRHGYRGLPGGSSLARLLAKKRGALYRPGQPGLTEDQILRWADAHFRRTGEWPTRVSGHIPGTRFETWAKVAAALRCGYRGLKGGLSLHGLLVNRRGARQLSNLPRLDEQTILRWADAHHKRTGEWPNKTSGTIPEAPGEDWARVCGALYRGGRGLSGACSLSELLASSRSAPIYRLHRRLSIHKILLWAGAYHERTGRWPSPRSGPVAEAPHETWEDIDDALRAGRRGFPGGSSLRGLLKAERRPRPPRTGGAQPISHN